MSAEAESQSFQEKRGHLMNSTFVLESFRLYGSKAGGGSGWYISYINMQKLADRIAAEAIRQHNQSAHDDTKKRFIKALDYADAILGYLPPRDAS
ncbi:MAG: hypothetical protein RLZ25_1198 [Pseudomonadota bacterium]|jgi:hypothetical protein